MILAVFTPTAQGCFLLVNILFCFRRALLALSREPPCPRPHLSQVLAAPPTIDKGKSWTMRTNMRLIESKAWLKMRSAVNACSLLTRVCQQRVWRVSCRLSVKQDANVGVRPVLGTGLAFMSPPSQTGSQ